MVGIHVAALGQESIHGVVGPMSPASIEDLELFQKSVLDQEPWENETSLIPLPWKTVTPNRDITVAIMWDDGYFVQHNISRTITNTHTVLSVHTLLSRVVFNLQKKSSLQPV